MSVLTVRAWRCDKCGHVWLADPKPKRCSKCKKVTWDIGVRVRTVGAGKSVVGLMRPNGEIVTVAEMTRSEASVFNRKHDPKTCRLYGCGMCATLKA